MNMIVNPNFKIYLIIIILFIISLLLVFVTKKYPRAEMMTNNRSIKKIPLYLYKTGPFTQVPVEIYNAIDYCCKMLNSQSSYFNDHMCRSFIKDNFNKRVLEAYDSLIPTAYKADLWRFCILYINGGIYGDLTQTILQPYDINLKMADMILVKDRNVCNSINNIQISFMASIPKNNFLKYLIDKISESILNKERGNCALDITGPTAFGRYFCNYFGVGIIKNGLNIYKGLDNRLYKIDIPFKVKQTGDYIVELNNVKFIRNKIRNHIKLVYNNDKRNNYQYQYRINHVFKN